MARARVAVWFFLLGGARALSSSASRASRPVPAPAERGGRDAGGPTADVAERWRVFGVEVALESDPGAAKALFERVLQTEMVSFYEYAMAQALLRTMAD